MTSLYPREVTPDRGWAWVILFVTFFVHVTVDGVVFSFGVLFVELMDYFQSSRSNTAWISSLLQAILHAVGILCGTMITYWGFRAVSFLGAIIGTLGLVLCFVSTQIWHLFICIGVIVGIGYGLLYFGSYMALQHWFHKRISLANGLSSAGAGIGTFVFAPLTNLLIDTFGWQGAILIIAGLFAQNVALSLLLPTKVKATKVHVANNETHGQESVFANEAYAEDEPHRITSNIPGHLTERKDKVTDSCAYENNAPKDQPTSRHVSCSTICHDILDTSILKSASIVIFLIAFFFLQVGFVVPYMFLPDMAIGYGVSRTNAALLISFIAAANTIARVVFGFVGDYIPQYRNVLLGVTLFAGGIANILSLWCNTFLTLAIYAVVHGISVGCLVSLTPVVLRDNVGVSRVSKAMGFQFLVVAFVTLWCGPVSGWLFDTTGSYSVPFTMTGIFLIIGGLLVSFLSQLSKALEKCCGSYFTACDNVTRTS